ncbi:hypothetical protein PPL_04201 [Heterostelium album PN500]|uniref:Uncharacterized protein n=1 Tax=Heterostelium pallidum (strain ATCC 26659 / Pp 5 / PN500) TaxID=670386 RepID=D3B6X0_HETP5|nr:hypothetical protein PPL_04201 [Heterostelium album PN500]EFA82513.1 hypothetical protein PPL_04201 [Heterostelium album PN500]|eukprot:XP_020434630.1 hypothetical protein PPL_04201 [Heterostelium album PN500]
MRYYLLHLLSNDIEQLEFYRELKDVSFINLNQLLVYLERNNNRHGHIDLFKTIEDSIQYFNPLKNQQTATATASNDSYLDILCWCCKSLESIQQSNYSLLLYILMRSNNYIKSNDLWVGGVKTILKLRDQYKDNSKLTDTILKLINNFCVPEVFKVDKKFLEQQGVKRSELVELCWRYTVTRPVISYDVILGIQRFLQELANSDRSSRPRLSVDLLNSVEKLRNDYFDRHQQEEEEDEEDDSDDLYDYEIELGIYLLTSLFYLCAWRYFKFLVSGSSSISKSTTTTTTTNSNSNSNNSSSSSTAVATGDNTLTFDINSSNNNSLYMITHQVLIYSNADENFKDVNNTFYDKNLSEAIRYLTLCMDCYSDLNQEPWNDRFKELSMTWNSPVFYWINTSLADCHYFYESYSSALTFYKQIKQQLSTETKFKTLIPVRGNHLISFDPTEDLWVNRLFLHIAMTNHSEIENSIVYLLEILISIPLADQMHPPTRHPLRTIKPFFTVYSLEEITFWCIDSLAACYERLGMVGEMTVLFQCYWDYYKPRFQKIVHEIQKSGVKTPQGQTTNTKTLVFDDDDDGLPLSNISKKDLQKGFFFPRFFKFIVNIEMLEEFSLLLNQGYHLDILQSGSKSTQNKDILKMIEQHVTTSTKRTDMSLSLLLNKFFNEELEQFSNK